MDFRAFLEQYLRRRMSLIWENREVFRVVLSEILVNAELRERYLKHVVDPTMRIAEENFRSRMEQEEMRETKRPWRCGPWPGPCWGSWSWVYWATRR